MYFFQLVSSKPDFVYLLNRLESGWMIPVVASAAQDWTGNGYLFGPLPSPQPHHRFRRKRVRPHLSGFLALLPLLPRGTPPSGQRADRHLPGW